MILNNNLSLNLCVMLSDTVHTEGESLQDGLGDMWTHEMTLASAYILCHLSAIWLQFQRIGRSLR